MIGYVLIKCEKTVSQHKNMLNKIGRLKYSEEVGFERNEWHKGSGIILGYMKVSGMRMLC
jgi:hypothetical protein